MSNGLITPEGHRPEVEGTSPEVVSQNSKDRISPLNPFGGESFFSNFPQNKVRDIDGKLIEDYIIVGEKPLKAPKINRYSFNSRCLQAVGVAAITLASFIPLSAFLDRKNVQASEPRFSDPSPQKLLEAKEGMPSLIQPAQVVNWTDRLGRSRVWGEIDNFRFGAGPNNPDRRVGTIPDTANGAYLWFFQARDALYPETTLGNGVSVLINGIAVFGSRGVLATAVMVSTDGSMYRGCAEFIPDNDNPLDYDSRVAFCEGFPTSGTENYGSVFTFFTTGIDTDGRYIDAGIRDGGAYRHRFDNQGKPVGIWTKIKQQVFYQYLPMFTNGLPH